MGNRTPNIVDFAAALIRRQDTSLLELEDYYEVKINYYKEKAVSDINNAERHRKKVDSAIVIQRNIQKEAGSNRYFHSLY